MHIFTKRIQVFSNNSTRMFCIRISHYLNEIKWLGQMANASYTYE
jgi:hypothetical protein